MDKKMNECLEAWLEERDGLPTTIQIAYRAGFVDGKQEHEHTTAMKELRAIRELLERKCNAAQQTIEP